MTDTPLDKAWLAHRSDPENQFIYNRFLERVMDCELHVLLKNEVSEGTAVPQVFDLEDGTYVLAFDQSIRLAGFVNGPAPFVALAGRQLIGMLAPDDVGIGLNLGGAPSETLLPPEIIQWMARRIADAPGRTELRADGITSPTAPDPRLLAALEPKLAAIAHNISEAHLVDASFKDQSNGLLLVLVDAAEDAQQSIAAAIAETVRFSGFGDFFLDVTFLSSQSDVLQKIKDVSISFELPKHVDAPTNKPTAPGMDPARPPILS